MLGLPCGAAGLALGLLGCGSQSLTTGAHTQAPGRTQAASPVRRGRLRLRVSVTTTGDLPEAVQDAAAVSLDQNRLALLGGVDAADASTASIVVLAGGSVVRHDSLPAPQHDAQAARLGHYVYVFGGGVVASFNHILRYDPTTGSVLQVGQLPTAASDVAVATLGSTAYIVGGYDGTNWLNSILAWHPGARARPAGRLPFGLRYAAVAAAGHRLIIAGGTTTRGVTDAILSFDPVTGAVEKIGRLPMPLTHASAASVDGRILMVGGRREVTGGQTSAILEINPSSGAVRQVGRLPHPISDGAVVALSGNVVVAGGEDASGPQRTILELAPHLTPAPSMSGP